MCGHAVVVTEKPYLKDRATLNKHRKATSEAYTGSLPILAKHKQLDHHHPLH